MRHTVTCTCCSRIGLDSGSPLEWPSAAILEVCISHLRGSLAVPLQALITQIPSKSKTMLGWTMPSPPQLHKLAVLFYDVHWLRVRSVLTGLAWRMGISEWIRAWRGQRLTKNSLKTSALEDLTCRQARYNTCPAFIMAGTKCTWYYIPKLTATISARALEPISDRRRGMLALSTDLLGPVDCIVKIGAGLKFYDLKLSCTTSGFF